MLHDKKKTRYMFLQKKPVHLKKWTADRNYSFKIKWYANLRNGPTQLHFVKIYYFYKNLIIKIDHILKVPVTKKYIIPM